jgi:hypothetical protein
LDTNARNALRDLELEVEAEGREWMRRRLEDKLQAQVEEPGAIFPSEREKSASSPAGNAAAAHGLRGGQAQGCGAGKILLRALGVFPFANAGV